MSPSSEFENKIHVERRKIETDRYFEGIKRQHDPRDDEYYDLDWIIKNAVEFSRKWRESCCRTCVLVKECGYNLETKCEKYSEEKNNS
jgi:hypothetical protein